MHPVEFPEQNCCYAKDQDEYRPLPAHRTADGQVISCWHLTLGERLKLLLRGRLWFSQLTFGAPLQPQLPQVNKPVDLASR